MFESDIIEFQVGLSVAVRSGYKSHYGTIVKVHPAWVDVQTPEGTHRYARVSRRRHGWPGTKYDCPYLASVAVARAKDAEYAAAAATARAKLIARGVAL